MKVSNFQLSPKYPWRPCETVICLFCSLGKAALFFPPLYFVSLSFTMADHFATQHPSLCQQPNAPLDPRNLDPEEESNTNKAAAAAAVALTTRQHFLTLNFVARRRHFERLVSFVFFKWQEVNRAEQ